MNNLVLDVPWSIEPTNAAMLKTSGSCSVQFVISKKSVDCAVVWILFEHTTTIDSTNNP